MPQNMDSDNLSMYEPQQRLKQLINYSNQVDVDPHVSPRLYFRSGAEMVRMANVYYKEGNLENAYVLYLKFMTLFLEKIREHPNFKTVVPSVIAANKADLREILPKAEKLKAKLLEQYTQDYNRYKAEVQKLEKEEAERKKAREAKRKEGQTVPVGTQADFVPSIHVRDPGNFDNVSYPDPNESDDVQPSAPPASILEPTDKSVPEPPSFDRSKKPSDITIDRYTKAGLRTVIVPVRVMTLFQSMAQRNTANNIETCGVLAGKLEKNQLIITHMILPKQKGTSDSCATMNEEEIFDYQDQNSLITIGWIHTHPTQTAFLSSVDLHTHCPYQLLMPEAIAIVCAPKYNQTGFYVLTPNYGLQYIANCRKSGFHPHPTDPPLFMNAEHVKMESNAPLDVLDLRK